MIVTFLSIIFGELIPKRLGMMMSEKIARLVAVPMDIFSKVTHPIVWLLALISNAIFKLFNIKPATDNAVTKMK